MKEVKDFLEKTFVFSELLYELKELVKEHTKICLFSILAFVAVLFFKEKIVTHFFVIPIFLFFLIPYFLFIVLFYLLMLMLTFETCNGKYWILKKISNFIVVSTLAVLLFTMFYEYSVILIDLCKGFLKSNF